MSVLRVVSSSPTLHQYVTRTSYRILDTYPIWIHIGYAADRPFFPIFVWICARYVSTSLIRPSSTRSSLISLYPDVVAFDARTSRCLQVTRAMMPYPYSPVVGRWRQASASAHGRRASVSSCRPLATNFRPCDMDHAVGRWRQASASARWR